MNPGLLVNLTLSAFLLITGAPALSSSDGPKREPPLDRLRHARESIYKGDYDEALKRFSAISTEYPASPAGDLYQAVTLIWRSRVDAKLDAGTREYDDRIEALLTSLTAKAEAIRSAPAKTKQDEVESLYYLGTAAAARGRIALYQNHGIPAAKQARMAQDLFEELMKLDRNYYDAYYAPGAIYYAVGLLIDTTLAKLVVQMLGQKSLPVGDIERGRAYLKTAAEKSPLADIDAKLALLEIYALNESRFDLALPLARELHEKYPGNQTFARYLMRVYSGLKDKKKLADTAQQVLKRVRDGKPNFGTYVKAEAERYLAEASKM
jgi:outer membrane protein assembly factor BamD (BamD/ComL family)